MASTSSKRFIMLGMGSFGSALATRLADNGCRVTGVDSRRDRLDSVKNTIHEAIIGDATDRELLENLPIKDATSVFISLGETISKSLLATLHVKELGAREIVVKGVTKEHGKILSHLGANRVVYPEEEVARELADKASWPNVLDFLPIDPEYSVVEITVPESLEGKTLADADLRNKVGVFVLGLKNIMSGQFMMVPEGRVKLMEDQILLVIGKEEELTRLREMT